MTDFFSLSPDVVLQSVEKQGYLATGELYQLNSYENRVFNIRLEASAQHEETQLIGKYYRPGRWNLAALKEEHDFLQVLKNEGIEVVAPLLLKNQSTLDTLPGPIYYSLFPKKTGRMPEEFMSGDWERIGSLLARLHNCGAQKKFRHRPTMGTSQHLGWQSLEVLEHWVSPEIWPRYENACLDILDFLDERLDPNSFLRIHGDCHRGNILSTGDHFFFVDFDDSINGPVVQDLWMLLPGDIKDTALELEQFLTGYTQFRDFKKIDLDLIPALRGLRIFSYAAWIANRWKDPSFPRLFPQFNSYNYWSEEVESLERMAWSL